MALPPVVHTTFHELRGSGKSWLIDEKLKIVMGSYSLPSYKLSIVFFNRKYADSFDMDT